MNQSTISRIHQVRTLACFISMLVTFALVAKPATAQNSSLLHQVAPQVLPTSPRGMPKPTATSAVSTVRQIQARSSRLLQGVPTDTVDPGGTVTPPEFIPDGSIPPLPPRFSLPNSPVQGQNLPGPPVGPYSPYSPDINPAVGLRGVSWTYQPAPPLRQFKLQDIVTIRVDEISRSQAQGQAQKRRNSIFLAALTDWVRLTRYGVVPDPQEDGDPTIASQSQSNFRALSSVEARESVSFNISARIVDIRPNGNLVLEARKTYRHNDNLWETSLSGICRAQDIAPDNVILSRDLIDLEIQKLDQGYVHDGYKRGWFQRLFDGIKPF